jgi:hypothetical protein
LETGDGTVVEVNHDTSREGDRSREISSVHPVARVWQLDHPAIVKLSRPRNGTSARPSARGPPEAPRAAAGWQWSDQQWPLTAIARKVAINADR